ncbi:MAG TPA: ABC transporter ATP-binding protein [Candidatus Binatia bacterium]|nr:ABC transporter ATP-binding protein [Candidatus Binatia bacterium]
MSGEATGGPERPDRLRPPRIFRGRPGSRGRGSEGPGGPPSQAGPTAAGSPVETPNAPGGRRAEANRAAGAGSDGRLIRTRNLTKRYGDLVAVDRLTFEVRAGEIYGLLGPNGAGKTTTILMLLGLSEPTAGEARVVGLDPTRHPLEVKRRVGYLPDNAGFYGALSGRANLRYTARLNGLSGPEAERRIDEVLEQVGLADDADRRVETYSRGMRQRLGIADALVKDPQILILDEPTIAIDPQGVAEILALIRRLVDERGLAILLSSHLLEQVQSICDRVGIFVKGRLVAQGTVEELARTLGSGEVQLEVGVADGADGTERAIRALGSLPGVRGVSVDPPTPGRLRLTADRDVVPHVAPALVSAGLSVVHLRRLDQGLAEIYRRAVAAQEGSTGGGA